MGMPVTELLHKAQMALQLSQGELGTRLGASVRTGQRWAVGLSTPIAPHFHRLAREIFPLDRALAAEAAAHGGTTLVELGLVPPPPPPPSPDRIVDSVVCAAAEAIDVMPGAVRPALLAAFTRAREIGLTMDVMEAALRARVAPVTSGRPQPSPPAARGTRGSTRCAARSRACLAR
jgi:hypothetical protein